MQAAKLLSICSILFLCSCANGPKRPDTNIAHVLVTVDESGQVKAAKLHGYNMLKDFNSDGYINPDAKAWERPITSLKDLRGYLCTDVMGEKNLKVYLDDARNYTRDHCK